MAELLLVVQAIGLLLLLTCTYCNAQEVGTEPHITLGVGTSATLPCAYENRVFAVYWKKSEIGASEAENYVVVLDARSTPRTRMYHMDGFNITDDFSLTIADVSFQDEGRYFCIVSDHATGTLVTGYTDVTVEKRVVIGETSMPLQAGRGATIPCQFDDITTGVHWRKDGLLIGDDDRYQISTEDHSLFVSHVTIWDAGIYACEYSDLGEKIVYQKEKHVTIIGTPDGPVPSFDACKNKLGENTQNCTLTSKTALDLTCSVKNYFPNISLVFLHNEEIIEPLTSEETSNSDGTKNMVISIRAATSDEPYVCMADGIPGIEGERSALVVIERTDSSDTTIIVIAVLVGGLFVVAFACAVTVYIRRKHRQQSKKDQDSHEVSKLLPRKEYLSSIEVWELLRQAEGSNALDKLVEVLRSSQVISTDVPSTLSAIQVFINLCDSTGRKKASKKEMLEFFQESDDTVNFEKCLDDFNKDQQQTISDDLVKHVLWSIDGKKIGKLLHELEKAHGYTTDENQPDVVREPLRKLLQWKESSKGNPRVQLCRALERSNCKPTHQTFFLVKEKWMKSITLSEVRKLASVLTTRYRARLDDVLLTGEGGTNDENVPGDERTGTVEENLFDTCKMIEDWIAQQEGSPFYFRCKIWKAAMKTGCYNVLGSILAIDDEPKPSGLGYQSTLQLLYHLDDRVPCLPYSAKYDDNMLITLGKYQVNFLSKNEVKQSITYLKPEHKLQVLDKLGIKKPKKVTDDEIVKELCQWRDNEYLSSHNVAVRKKFYDAVNELESQVFIPTDGELPMVAANQNPAEVKRSVTSLDPPEKEVSSVKSQSKDTISETTQESVDSSSKPSCEKPKTPRKQLEKSRQDCVPQRKGDYVFDAELPDIGFAMLMEDILPFSEALGLSIDELHKYRKPPTLRCVSPGIRQLIKKAREEKKDTRSVLCDSLVKAGYLDIARMAFLGNDQSLSEMYAITLNLNERQMLSLATKLGLTEVDIDLCRKIFTKKRLFEVIRRWRRQKHSPLYYYREELAHAIKSATRHKEFATKQLTEIKADVYSMLRFIDHLTDKQMKKLASRLGLSDTDFRAVKPLKELFKDTDKRALIRLWRNKLHPRSYNYEGVLKEALHSVINDEVVSFVEDDISHAEESTENLLAELPEMVDIEVTLLAARLSLKEDNTDARRVGSDERLELLQCWKKKIHPPLYHYGLELIKALMSVDNLEEYAREVLSGMHSKREPHQAVMVDIFSRLTDDERKRICNIMGKSSKNPDFAILMDMMTAFVANRDKKDKKETEEQHRLKRQEMMDKLFSEGYSELAQELILLTS